MSFFSDLFSFFSSIFSGSTGKIVESIGDIAKTAVSDLDDVTGLSGAEKKEQAFDNISEKAAEEGIEVATHAINLAIEMAVAALKD